MNIALLILYTQKRQFIEGIPDARRNKMNYNRQQL